MSDLPLGLNNKFIWFEILFWWGFIFEKCFKNVFFVLTTEKYFQNRY